MEIGLGLWGMQTPALAPAAWSNVYQDVLEEAELADELGFAFFLTTEHHFWYDGYCPSVLVACAAVAARTRRIRLGTGMVLLPMHDPLQVVEAATVVDRLSGGRLVLGVSLGYRDVEFDAFGLERRERARRLTDGVALLRAAWGRDTVTFRGDVYHVDDAPGPLRPVQEELPVWIGAGSVAAVERAGRLGCPVLIPAVVPLERVVELGWRYREAARQANVPPDRCRLGVMRVVWVDETDAAARAYMVPLMRAMWLEQYAGWGLFLDERGRAIRGDRAALLEQHIDRAVAESYVGGPDTVRRGLAAIRDAGVDFVCCRIQTGAVRSAPLRRCMERLAQDVMPHV